MRDYNDVQNVQRQPAQELNNDDVTAWLLITRPGLSYVFTPNSNVHENEFANLQTNVRNEY